MIKNKFILYKLQFFEILKNKTIIILFTLTFLFSIIFTILPGVLVRNLEKTPSDTFTLFSMLMLFKSIVQLLFFTVLLIFIGNLLFYSQKQDGTYQLELQCGIRRSIILLERYLITFSFAFILWLVLFFIDMSVLFTIDQIPSFIKINKIIFLNMFVLVYIIFFTSLFSLLLSVFNPIVIITFLSFGSISVHVAPIITLVINEHNTEISDKYYEHIKYAEELINSKFILDNIFDIPNEEIEIINNLVENEKDLKSYIGWNMFDENFSEQRKFSEENLKSIYNFNVYLKEELYEKNRELFPTDKYFQEHFLNNSSPTVHEYINWNINLFIKQLINLNTKEEYISILNSLDYLTKNSWFRVNKYYAPEKINNDYIEYFFFEYWENLLITIFDPSSKIYYINNYLEDKSYKNYSTQYIYNPFVQISFLKNGYSNSNPFKFESFYYGSVEYMIPTRYLEISVKNNYDKISQPAIEKYNWKIKKISYWGLYCWVLVLSTIFCLINLLIFIRKKSI